MNSPEGNVVSIYDAKSMEFDRDQSRSNTHFDCEWIQSNIFDKSLSKSGSEFLASSSETSSTPTTNTRVVPGG
jgi:hypothetical protein